MGRNKWKDDNRMWSFVNWMVIEVTLIFVLFQFYSFTIRNFFKNFFCRNKKTLKHQEVVLHHNQFSSLF